MSKLRLYRCSTIHGATDARSKNAGYPHQMCDRHTTDVSALGLDPQQQAHLLTQIESLDENDRLFAIAAPGADVESVEYTD
jgi:hypothetical protein